MEDTNTSWLTKGLTAAIVIALAVVVYLSYQAFFGGDNKAPKANPVIETHISCNYDGDGNIIITTTTEAVSDSICQERIDTASRFRQTKLVLASFQDTLEAETVGPTEQVGEALPVQEVVRPRASPEESVAATPSPEADNANKKGNDNSAADGAGESSAEAASAAPTEKTFIIKQDVLIERYGSLIGVSYQIWLMLMLAIIAMLIIWNWATANMAKKLRMQKKGLEDSLRKAGSKSGHDDESTDEQRRTTPNVSRTDRLKSRDSAQKEEQKTVASPYGSGSSDSDSTDSGRAESGHAGSGHAASGPSDPYSDYAPYIRDPEDAAQQDMGEPTNGNETSQNATVGDDVENCEADNIAISDIAFVEKLVSEYNALGKGDWNRFGENYHAQAFSNKRSDVSRIFPDQQARFWLIESKVEPNKAYLVPGPETNIRWHNLRDVKSDHPLYHFFGLTAGESLTLIAPTMVSRDDAQGEWVLYDKGEVSGVMPHDG